MNKVILIGRLTRDPELKDVGTTQICSFGLAVNRRFKRENSDNVDFFDIDVWAKQGENCAKYLNKGSQVAISGRVEMQTWNDNDGNKKYKTKIVADEVNFLSSNNNEDKNENTKPSDSKPSNNSGEDELPF